MNASEVAGLRPAQSAFGRQLKRLRVTANLTQAELAERAGVSERLVSDYERAILHRPRRDTVLLLADGLLLDGRDREEFLEIARGVERNDLILPNVTHPILFNVPAPATRIVGRDREIESISNLLLGSETRLLTLTGPGGVGKTCLAIEVATRLGSSFPDGVEFIDLAPLREPELVLPTIARSLGVASAGRRVTAESLAPALKRRRMLLILDNFEHLIDACTAISDLLSRCERLTILITSRELLQIRFELAVVVDPLQLPDLDRLMPLEHVATVPAVALFVNRAVAALGGLVLSEDNVRVVAEITVRLEGIPLALELAATRLTVLTPDELLARLDQLLPVLTRGARDLPERLQAMHAAIDWSYELLENDEKRLFRSLSIFSGGFTLDAAEAVSGDERILDSLSSLVNKSMIFVSGSKLTERRFQMLEMIREFGLARLSDMNEASETRSRHLKWCAKLIDRASPKLQKLQQAHWLRRLSHEQNNIRQALEWALEKGEVESAGRICGGCFEYWEMVSQFEEGRKWIERVIARDENIPPEVRARLLLGLGVLAYKQADYERAEVLNDALVQYRALGDDFGIAYTLCSLGKTAMVQQDYDLAVENYEESLALFTTLNDDFWVGRLHHNLGLIAFDRQNYELASELLEEALTRTHPIGGPDAIGSTLNNLALVALARGEFIRATALQQEALRLWLTIGKKEGAAHSLENLALVAVSLRELERAATFFGAADSVRTLIGAPGRMADQEVNRLHIEAIRDHLGNEEMSVAWQKGSSLSLDDAIALAMDDR